MMVQRRLVRFVRYARLPFAVTVSCGVAASAAAVVAGFALAELVRRVVVDGGSAATSGPLVLAVCATVARLLLLWARDLAGTWTASRIKQRLRAQLVARLFELGPSATVRRRVGDVQATVVDGVEALQALRRSARRSTRSAATAPPS